MSVDRIIEHKLELNKEKRLELAVVLVLSAMFVVVKVGKGKRKRICKTREAILTIPPFTQFINRSNQDQRLSSNVFSSLISPV